MPAQSVYVELYHLFRVVRSFRYIDLRHPDSPSAEVMTIGVRLVNNPDGGSSGVQTRIDMPLRFWTFSAQRRNHERPVQKDSCIQVPYKIRQRLFTATTCGVSYAIEEQAFALSPIRALG